MSVRIARARRRHEKGPYLPTRRLLMTVVGIAIHYKRVDAIQVQFTVWGIQDGLSDHLGVTELRLYVLVVVVAEVHAIGAHHDGRGADGRRLDARRGSAALRRWRRSR